MVFMMWFVGWCANILVAAPVVKADTFGVVGQNGYYDGAWHDWANHTWVMSHGIPLDWDTPDYVTDITTVDEFINVMQAFLNNPANPDGDAARASAIINMMMGVRTDDPRLGPPSPTRWQIGVSLAQSLFPQWEATVRAYANGSIPGASVNFDEMVFMPFGTINGFGVATDASGAVAMSDVIFGGVHDEGTEEMIVFHHPDGTVFSIKKKCANMTGVQSAFPSSVLAEVSISAGPALTVNPGDFVDMNITLTNNSALAASLPGKVEAYRPGQVNVPCAGNPCSPANQNDFGGLTASRGYSTGSTLVSPYSGGSWFWNTNSLPGGAVTTASFRFQVSAAASGIFSFPVCFGPADATNTVVCTTVSYTVVSPRYPSISAQNGDVYAGGGICGGVMSLASPVTGNLVAGSYGDYVVAASGTISHFSSNRGSNTLNLGANGGYATLCRPNLLAVAAAYTGPRGPDIAGPSFNVSGKSGVYYYNGGGALQLYGTISGNLTIVVPNGSVLINGSIQVDPGGFSARSLPGLGIIAQGNIGITAGVTRVDAYLFSSQGRIDTCLDHSSACANQLTVNGFLMARQMSFSRLGASGSGAVIAERVVLNPQIYLNPPPLFSSSVSAIELDGQGEKQPLF
jgi:hypothetical protein